MKQRKLSQQAFDGKSSKINSILGAALAIPAVGASFSAEAQQAPAENSIIKFFYADYKDYDGDSSRMRVQEPIAWARTSLGNNFEAEGSFSLDSMGGASPYYHNTLTGASGSGVDDIRRAGDLKVTKYFDRFSIGLGGVVSDEDDYLSRGGLVEGKVWTEDKNTTFTFGMGGNSDEITSSIQESLDESRRTYNFVVGITQVIDANSIIQTNLTYNTANGYLSDPYKTLDNRPGGREEWILLNRYNRYFEDLDGSFHGDYRLFTDSWGITAHTIDLAWYQPLGTMWTVRPGFRYYSQDSADFFLSDFPPEVIEGFMSADQRISGFGGITLSAKIIAELGHGFSADAQAGFMEQRAEWKLGSGGSSVIDPFYAHFFTFAISKSF